MVVAGAVILAASGTGWAVAELGSPDAAAKGPGQYAAGVGHIPVAASADAALAAVRARLDASAIGNLRLDELRGMDGKVLARSASALRMGAGTVWFSPGIDSLFGIVHSGLASAQGIQPPHY